MFLALLGSWMWGAGDTGLKMIYDLLRSTVQENEKLGWWRGKLRTQSHKIHLGMKGDRQGWLHSMQDPVKRQIPLFKKQAQSAIKSTKM